MLRHVPEGRQQFGLIDAGHKLDRFGVDRFGFVIFGREQHLAAVRLGVQHGDADDLRSERPEAALLGQLGAAGVAGGFILDLRAFAEEVFLLRFIELFQRQRGRFNIEDQFGHGAREEMNQDGKPVVQTRFAIPVSSGDYFFFFAIFFLAFFLAAI